MNPNGYGGRPQSDSEQTHATRDHERDATLKRLDATGRLRSSLAAAPAAMGSSTTPVQRAVRALDDEHLAGFERCRAVQTSLAHR
jgi:hypothetical protein